MLPWKWEVILWFDRQVNWSPGNSSKFYTWWCRSLIPPMTPSWTIFNVVKGVNSTSIDQIVTISRCCWWNRKWRSPNGCVDHSRTVRVNYSDNQPFDVHRKSYQITYSAPLPSLFVLQIPSIRRLFILHESTLPRKGFGGLAMAFWHSTGPYSRGSESLLSGVGNHLWWNCAHSVVHIDEIL